MTMSFDLIMFLIIGVAAGAIASFYMGRQQELVPNLLIGIVLLARRRQSDTVTRTAVDPAAGEQVTRKTTRSTDDTVGL